MAEKSTSSSKQFRARSKDGFGDGIVPAAENSSGILAVTSTGLEKHKSPTTSTTSGTFAGNTTGSTRAFEEMDSKPLLDSRERSFIAPGRFMPTAGTASLEANETVRDKVFSFVDSKYFQITMTFFTVFALWGDDWRLCGWHKQADPVFHVLYFLTFLAFAVELILHSTVTEEYKWSFFFWLDLTATISLLIDIPWIMEPIMAFYSDSTDVNVGSTAARTSRASRAGTKTGRIVRIVRLVRLLRLVNLSGKCGRAPKSELDEDHAPEGENKQEKQVKASRLGKMLSEQTTRTVIIGVLCTLMVLPFIGEDNPSLVANHTFGFALENIFWFGLSACTTVDEFRKAQNSTAHISCASDTDSAWVSPEGYEFMLYEFAQASRYNDDAVRLDKIYRPVLGLNVPDLSKPSVGVNGNRVYGTSRRIRSIETTRCSPEEQLIDDSEYPFRMWEGFMPQLPCPENTCCWKEHVDCWDMSDSCPWRDNEVQRVYYTPPGCDRTNWKNKCNSFHIKALYLDRYKTETEAEYSLLQTTFIVMLLGTGAMMFANDTQILVINPIEKMVSSSLQIIH